MIGLEKGVRKLINSIQGGSVVHQGGAAESASQPPNTSGNSKAPEDTVTISSAAKAKLAATVGDADHDGDRE
jgi:hypothetical protein